MRERFQANFDQFEIDSKDGLKHRSGRALHLAPKELAAFCLLLRHAGKIVPKSEFVRTVWNDAAVSDSSIMRCVSQIKKCLKEVSPGAEKLIKSEYGHGYRFVGVLSKSQSFITDEAFYAFIDISPDFIALKDGQGRWLAVNKAGLDLYGLADKPWQGKTDSELANMVPEYREGLAACVTSDEAAWRGRETHYTMETLDTEEGRKIFHVAKSPLFDADGQRNMLVVSGRDVTKLVSR